MTTNNPFQRLSIEEVFQRLASLPRAAHPFFREPAELLRASVKGPGMFGLFGGSKPKSEVPAPTPEADNKKNTPGSRR